MKRSMIFVKSHKSMNNIGYRLLLALLLTSCAKDGGMAESSTTDRSDGKGGSMARFAIQGDMLYTVSANSMQIFAIEEAANPTNKGNLYVGFDIETVFPMDTLLFIGSRSGMFVYDITEQQFPKLLSQVQHIRSCDPVVAQGNYAYVTLNTNFSACGASMNNVLNIYDITNVSAPELKHTVSMTGPTGLGIDGDRLFVCDKGLKVFDLSDPVFIRQIDDFTHIDDVNIRETYDVIPVNGLLFLIAKEGLFQFDYAGDRIKFLSKILINPNIP